jgi:hypothetical protein
VSLIPGNIEVLAFGMQTDKDTPATTPVIAIALEDCTLDPGVQYGTLAETDGNALEGNDVVTGAQPGGTFKKYVRPSEEDFFLLSLLGKNVDTGAGAPFTHTQSIDPAAPFSTHYLTCWDIWPGVSCVRYDGCRISIGEYSAKSGSVAAEVVYTLEALKATLGVVAPSLTGLEVSELPHTWAEFAATLGGVHGGGVDEWSLKIARNTGRFPGDNGLTSLDIPNGLASVMGSMTVAYQDDALLRAANTGSTGGTALTTTPFSEAVTLDLVRGAGLEVKFALAAAQIKNYKAAIKTDASPATASFDFKSLRDATLANFIQTVVKNALPHADRT